MGSRNEAAPWWSAKAAAAWQELASQIDELERAEQARDEAARRYLAALMDALREGRPAPSPRDFEAYGRGGGDDPEFPQYDPGNGGTTGGSLPDEQAPVWPPSAYAPVPGSDEYNRIAREGDASVRGTTVGSAGSQGAPVGPIGMAPVVVGPGPVVVAPSLPSSFSPPRPLPTPNSPPPTPGYTPAPAPTLPGFTPDAGYTPSPDNGPGGFGATPVVGPGPYLNDGGTATAAPTAVPSPTHGGNGDAEAKPGGPDEDRNWRQDKMVGDDVVEALEQAGYDVHEEKGGKGMKGVDVYSDSDGNLYVKPKGGQGPGTPLHVNLKDLNL